ncbi:hypothetical protein K435DRAFT_379061 [Dendrothele bispora CBS 962.96]|uniref:Uncharacterized protein n=1 Tax=Dendrothele bispora (strain CBS 962.96) TaxID=1314807 RepID=A0A4S8LAY1_DENBC|nr:hypothetical protein K435DRAFT_379061 [Dendrothele bispora CBS 962.96]
MLTYAARKFNVILAFCMLSSITVDTASRDNAGASVFDVAGFFFLTIFNRHFFVLPA